MENVRIENFLGGNKVIVGNKDSNLVLETLGKVYIKTGKQTRILTDILKLLDSAPTKKLESMIIIVNGVTEMENIEYPGDGFFIFNNVDQSLYISYDNRYIMLVEASQGDGDDMYVKRTGDSMSGQLELTTDNAPLIVASSKLINNLNANFIEGYSAKELAKKRVNETIYGDWTFNGNNVATDNWTFKENIKLNKDLVTDGSISTPMFASGFAGYGWRIDAETNMLTIDYLVVRKAMHVYEMVINKITATNGSLWVTNACKVETSYIPIVINPEEYKDVDGSGIPEYPSEVMNDLVDSDTCYMFLVPENKTSNGYYKYIVHVKDSTILSNNPVYRLGSKQIFEAKYPTMSSDNVSGFWVLTDEQFLTKELTPGDFSEVVSEDQIAEFNANVKLYYIYDKEFVATTPYTRITDITIYEETGEGIETFNVYDHYFAVNSNDKVKYFDNFYVVITENDAYPTLKANDIIRCQKWDSGEIKYYDAIVTNYPADYMYVIQKGPSVFDMYTDIRYDETGKVIMEDKYNNALYETTDYDTEPEDIPANKEDLKLGGIAKGDSLVQVGSTYNTQRQHAIYLTSTDDCAPYMTVISDLNRPDYSVLHQIPKYVKGDDGTDINYEWVVVLDDEGKPVIGKDGGALLKKKYLWKYTDTCKVRIGNLNGIRDDRFPDDRQPYGFGFYGQNVFLTGEFYLNNGQSVVDFSRDGIFLKYKRAGLDLVDMKDKENNPIYLTNPDGSYLYENGRLVPKQEIVLTADKIKFNTTENETVVELITKDVTGLAMLNIKGNIEAYGLEIGSTDSTGTFVGKCKISPDGKIIATDATFTNCSISGTVKANSGSIGYFTIDTRGLYYGDPSKWYDNNYKQKLSLIIPGAIRLQEELGYVVPGSISNIKVGLGTGADPYLSDKSDLKCASVGYFYRQMIADMYETYGVGLYYPAVKIISDNVLNRNVALFAQGAIVSTGGIVSSGHIVTSDVGVLDFSFGTNFLIYSNRYRVIYLPTLKNMKQVLNSNAPFVIRTTITVQWGAEDILVRFPDGENTLHFKNRNGGWWGSEVKLGRGDTLDILLVFDGGGEYYAQFIERFN